MSKFRRRAQTLVSQTSAAPAPASDPGDDVEVVVSESVQPEVESRYAVFRNPGPGTYRGDLLRRGLLPVMGEVSLPPDCHEGARQAGLQFVRWA